MTNLLRLLQSNNPRPLAKSALLSLAVASFTSMASMQASADAAIDECGYSVSTGITSEPGDTFIAWVEITNVSGEPATAFEVLLNTGGTDLQWVVRAEVESADDGNFWISQPDNWNDKKAIDQGKSYTFRYRTESATTVPVPYLVSVNGMPCDMASPEVTLSASQSYITSASELLLSANASDDSTVMKVVFERNGETIGVDSEAPFEMPITADASLNGFHVYTATAYDPSGNTAESSAARVFVSIDDTFLGTAPGGAEDYPDLLTYFDQITPENAGKWGAVEAERDVMNWDELDSAYEFAQANGLDFKFHTLLWGQQQPEWLDSLAPTEQLEEIEEWMSLVAARYPNLTMVEVVNEPLHAPPSYVEALGGNGESGWDWVITSFELARKYFPESQLILNDYQILIQQSFTADYLDIISALQTKGLIDAIGLQSHFLERAELPIVAENLDTLAATGMPLYISEFDLNVADDALHANKFRDLFSLFWEHPAVAGVTHWGHLEGSVWRENAYLLNADGSQRPAMDWLVCYLAGNTGCTVPEYIPAGWEGDEYGLTLQAEEYDAGQGVLALGDNVAYTDDGDWIVYYDVEMQAGWDTFWVSYAKGNEEVGSISVHFDDPESPAIVTVQLPPTAGGWGSNEEIAVPWLAGDVTHDVYIRFNDTYGVANLDSVRFGTPVTEPETSYGPNILENGTLDYGDYWWYTWSGTLEHTTDEAYAGPGSLKVLGDGGNGLAATGLTAVIEPGKNYAISVFVKAADAASGSVHVGSAIACDGNGTEYPWLVSNVTVNGSDWVELSGTFNTMNCEVVNQFQIQIESSTAGLDFYMDEASVREILSEPTQSNILPNGGFEANNTNGWSSWTGSSLAATTIDPYDGSYSLLASNRAAAGAYAVYNLTSLVEANSNYSVSAQIKVIDIAEGPAATGRLAAKVECSNPPEGHNTYPWIINNSGITPGVWTELSGQLTIPDCNVVEVLIFFEGTAENLDVQLDAISVIKN